MHYIKYYIVSLFTLFLCLGANNKVCAQQKLKFSIEEFAQDPFDGTARSEAYKRFDNDNRLYAIVKVKTDVDGRQLQRFAFSFGMMNSIPVYKDDLEELWLYVQRGAKHVTISREGYTTINKHDLGLTIAAGNTYVMRLALQASGVLSRGLQFRVTPADEGALVKVKREDSASGYELWGAVDKNGTIDRRVELGTYYYEVTAPNYEKCEGRIQLKVGMANHVEEVTLKPNFGWLEIDDAHGISGAEVYVDDRKIGTVPYREKSRWEARDGYQLMITNGELYKTYNSTFSIRQGEVTKLSPQLEANFAKTTIRVVNDGKADIYINGTKRGTGEWSGPLKAGVYELESRRDRHRPVKTNITVKANVAETFAVGAPVPIVGNVYVTTVPSGAKIYLDGEEKGVSPMQLESVLIGKHKVEVAMENYKREEMEVEVKEGQTSDARVQMRDFATFTVNSQPKGAQLEVEGDSVGRTPCTFEGASGLYDIVLTAKGYHTYHRKMQLSSSAPTLDIRMQRQLQKPWCGYVQLGLQAGSLMGIEGTVGGYLKNFNIEATLLCGIGKSVDLYWNSQDASQRPLHSVYKPKLAYGLKVGYGIIFGSRYRLTPQAGLLLLNVKDSEGHSKAYATSLGIGARFDVALARFIGVFVAPEYSMPIAKSDVYKKISDASSTVKRWSGGFNARMGLTFSF